MKRNIQLLTILSFFLVFAGTSVYGQSVAESAVKRAVVENPDASATADQADCCQGKEANRSRCCAISRARAAVAKSVQRPAGEVKVAKVQPAIRNKKAIKPEKAEKAQF